ncbi:hypothetical protein HY988_01065 [Candidatus Micrarchaeota archaeon]|nr:hypothetical protein [Candidatus Micrarchaeota archaeon]
MTEEETITIRIPTITKKEFKEAVQSLADKEQLIDLFFYLRNAQDKETKSLIAKELKRGIDKAAELGSLMPLGRLIPFVSELSEHGIIIAKAMLRASRKSAERGRPGVEVRMSPVTGFGMSIGGRGEAIPPGGGYRLIKEREHNIIEGYILQRSGAWQTLFEGVEMLGRLQREEKTHGRKPRVRNRRK